MLKPKLALKSRWLTFIEGALWVLKHKADIKVLVKDDASIGKKAERARLTLDSSDFWVNCHIMAGFGDLFFMPAHTWVQIDQGRRAPLMAQQVTKWMILLTHVESNPEKYFQSTIEIANKLNVSPIATIESIKLFAAEAKTRISQYFNPWLQPPLTLATMNDHDSAKVLLTEVRKNPEKYDLHGFLSEQVLSEFVAYVQGNDSNIMKYPTLGKWFVVVFGSCCVHNIDCERAFCLMRYLRHSKLSGSDHLISGLIEQAIQKKTLSVGIDFLTGLVDEGQLERMTTQELQDMLLDTLNCEIPIMNVQDVVTLKVQPRIIEHEEEGVEYRQLEEGTIEDLLGAYDLTRGDLETNQTVDPIVRQSSESTIQSEKSVDEPTNYKEALNPFQLLQSALSILLLGAQETVLVIANQLNSLTWKKQLVLNGCLDMSFTEEKVHPFETLVHCACQ